MRLFALIILPLSGVSMPAIILRRVDLPVPFIPMIPAFSPSCKKKLALSNIFLTPYAFVISSTVNIFIPI